MPATVEGKSEKGDKLEKDLEKEEWLKASEERLLKSWDNEDDAVFDELHHDQLPMNPERRKSARTPGR